MSRLVVLAAACLLIAGCSRPAKLYESEEGRFSVAFPGRGAPELSTQMNAGIAMKFVKVQAGDAANQVIYTDLDPLTLALPKLFFAAAEAGAVKSSGGTLVSSGGFEYGPDKLPAHEMVLDKNGDKSRTVFIIAKARLYTLISVGRGDYALGKEAKAFFDSFTIRN